MEWLDQEALKLTLKFCVGLQALCLLLLLASWLNLQIQLRRRSHRLPLTLKSFRKMRDQKEKSFGRKFLNYKPAASYQNGEINHVH